MENIGKKPLGRKSYGSIPHLSNSKLGPGDYHCQIGQERIATVKARDKHDVVIVQEKLDGSNVGVCKIDGKILAIVRAGHLAETSPYETHWIFKEWVESNADRFSRLLNEGERVAGEWLYHAVGTHYNLPHEPFVAFDIMMSDNRESVFTAYPKLQANGFVTPNTVHIGAPLPVERALELLGNGAHGAIDPVEGLIYRVERDGEVDFLVKYVKPGKENGIYLPEFSGLPYIKNAIAG
jgi:hypothetical protein